MWQSSVKVGLAFARINFTNTVLKSISNTLLTPLFAEDEPNIHGLVSNF